MDGDRVTPEALVVAVVVAAIVAVVVSWRTSNRPRVENRTAPGIEGPQELCDFHGWGLSRRNKGAPGWLVHIDAGRTPTERDVIEWAKEAEGRGAGEVLLTSMDRDGTKDGYDNELNRAVSEAVNVPVIASGGAGTLAHVAEAFTEGNADAALAASIFHYGEHTIREAKEYLKERGIPVRL